MIFAHHTESAINGTLTVKLTKAPETIPSAGDFVINRSVNGGSATVVAPISFTWNEESLTATISVATVAQTNAQQSVNYSVKYKETEAKSGAFTVAAQDALAVNSATIVDAQKVLVTFSRPMKTGTANPYSAENVNNYSITPAGSAVALTISKATLSADGKTATLELDTTTPLVQDTAYTLLVENVVQDVQGNALSLVTDYTTGIFFTDRVKPTVSSVVSTATGEAKISFSENLKATTIPTVVINGISVPAGDITVNKNEVTVAKNFFDTNSTSIKKGTSYPIVIAGAEDLVTPTANEMDLYTGTFVYQGVTDASAPTLTNVVAKDDHTLLVTFSEELIDTVTGLALTSTQKNGATNVAAVVFPSGLKVLKGSTDVFATNVYTKDGITFEVELNTATDVLYDSKLGESTATLTVEAKNFKDKALNLGATATKSLTISKDTTKPVVTKSSYDSTNAAFVVSFDQELSAVDFNEISIVNKATGASTPATAAAVSITDNVLTIDNSAGGLNLGEGNYTVVLGAGAVKDSAIAQNKNAATTTDITVSVLGVTDVKPEVVSAVVTGDVITVTYSEDVKADATTASATNVNNYKINGQPLPAGSVITYAANVATITMPSGSVETSGTKVFTVSNVQDIAGNTIDTVNKAVAFIDTVDPKLVSAVVDGDGKIILTFTENVDGKGDGTRITGPGATSEVQPNATDFIVYVNGVQTAVTLENGDLETQVKLVSSTVNFTSGTIVIKTHDTTTVGADEAGNTLKLNDSVTVKR